MSETVRVGLGERSYGIHVGPGLLGRADMLLRVNTALFQRCAFHSIQAAVNASGNDDRVVVMPGVYLEQHSRQQPTHDPACAQYTIKAEQSGDYQQDKGQVAAENMLAANPAIDLILGLNDSMALGAYNVINGKEKYKNVYVAASADGQKEALALIKQGGCTGRYISTGLNSPSLAAEQALQISVDVATGKKKPSDYPPQSFTKAVGIGCDNIDQYYDPNSVF